MDDYWIWWILAAVLVGAEMLTGTFYLLAVGIAFAFGGVAAWVGASLPMQLLTAGVLAVVGTMRRAPLAACARRCRRRSLALDIGQSVRVELECRRHGARRLPRHAVERRARVAATRRARHTMYIVATRGSTLVLGAERPLTRRHKRDKRPSQPRELREDVSCGPVLRSSRSRFSSSS